jgi:hypothetical protein
MGKDLPLAARKESTGIIPKAVPSSNNGSMGVYCGSLHIFIENTLGMGIFLSKLSLRCTLLSMLSVKS